MVYDFLLSNSTRKAVDTGYLWPRLRYFLHKTMASCDVKVTSKTFNCDYCAKKSKTNAASGFCPQCRKYLCSTCETFHGQLFDHEVLYGRKIPEEKTAQKDTLTCEIHVNQAVEFYCESHADVFCKFCQSIKHAGCDVRKIKQALQERNVKEEIQTKNDSLEKLQTNIDMIQNDIETKLRTLSKNKEELQGKLLEIRTYIDNCIEELDLSVVTDLGTLEANKQACVHLKCQVEAHCKSRKTISDEPSEEELFHSVLQWNHVHDKHKRLLTNIENATKSCGQFIKQSRHISSLIQQLPGSSYTSGDHLSEDHLSQADMTLPHSEIPVRLTKDQSCQVGNVLHDPFRDLTSLQENLEVADIDNNDQTGKQNIDLYGEEQASSEEIVEQCTVKTSFGDIVSCTSIKDISMEKDAIITQCCFFPSGRALLCVNNKTFMILDNELKVTSYINCVNSVGYLTHVDKDTAAVAVVSSGIWSIFFIDVSVTKDLQKGREIQLKILCEGMAGFNKTVYVYTNDLKISSNLMCKGVQMISKGGDILKNIQLLDYYTGFSINSYGNITYVSETDINGSKERSFKCVTSKGDVVSCSSMGKQFLDYSCRVYDDDGNGIGYKQSDKQIEIEVVKLDGTVKPILVKNGEEEKISAMFYNKYSNTLLVQFELYKKRIFGRNLDEYTYDHASNKLELYELEYTP